MAVGGMPGLASGSMKAILRGDRDGARARGMYAPRPAVRRRGARGDGQPDEHPAMSINRFAAIRDPDRLAAVRATGLLGTPPDPAFDRLTRLAAKALDAPIALFALVDADHLFIKSSHGFPEGWADRREQPLAQTSCWLAVATGEAFAVTDAREHPVFAQDIGLRELGLIAHLGLPIRVPSGQVVGTVCALDRQQRAWTEDDIQTLTDLAALVAARVGEPSAAPDPAVTPEHLVLDGIGDGVCALDRDGVCTYINPAGAALLGFAPDELLGQRLHDLIHHSHADGSPYPRHTCPVLSALAAGQGCRVESDVFWRRDLTSLAVRYRSFPIVESGAVIGGTLIFSDESARQRATEDTDQRVAHERIARIEAEIAGQRLAFLARASARCASSLDFETTLLNVAQAAVPYLADWSAVDLANDDGGLDRLASAHRDATKVELVRTLPRPAPIATSARFLAQTVLETGHAETIAEVSDHALFAVAQDVEHLRQLRAVGIRSLLCVPLSARGQTFGALTLGRADPDRPYQQADLLLAEDLARGAAVAIDHARQHRAAQDAVRVRNEFLVSISHDLRNPLANVKGFAQLLLRNVQQAETPETEEMTSWLTKIDTTATRMAGTIDELLDLARVQTGQSLELDRQPMNLVALAQRVVEIHRETAPEHQIRVEAAVPNLTGFWDERRLERVIANLLANAVRYSPSGGDVTITITLDEVDGRHWAVLAVRDQGIGIPAADLPRVFERFYRGTNVARGGTGVGLASAREIVEQHGGTIVITSEENVGTVVTIRLPLTRIE